MKKKLLTLFLTTICTLSLIGCDEFKSDTIATQSNRFIDTGDRYIVDNIKHRVYYDKTTNIVYLSASYSSAISLTPLIGTDKLPMTLDEYNSTK